MQEAADPGLSLAERGGASRELAAREHEGPGGRPVRVTRWTLDRWIGAVARRAGSTRWCRRPRQPAPRTPAEVLALAEALKRENPARTAAQVRRILQVASGWAPIGPDAAAACSSGWS